MGLIAWNELKGEARFVVNFGEMYDWLSNTFPMDKEYVTTGWEGQVIKGVNKFPLDLWNKSKREYMSFPSCRHILLVHRERVRQPIIHLSEVDHESRFSLQFVPRNQLCFLECVVEDVGRSFREEGQVLSFVHFHLQNHRWPVCIR